MALQPQNLRQLRKTLTAKEIAKKYGLSKEIIWSRLKEYRIRSWKNTVK